MKRAAILLLLSLSMAGCGDNNSATSAPAAAGVESPVMLSQFSGDLVNGGPVLVHVFAPSTNRDFFSHAAQPRDVTIYASGGATINGRPSPVLIQTDPTGNATCTLVPPVGVAGQIYAAYQTPSGVVISTPQAIGSVNAGISWQITPNGNGTTTVTATFPDGATLATFVSPTGGVLTQAQVPIVNGSATTALIGAGVFDVDVTAVVVDQSFFGQNSRTISGSITVLAE